MLTCFLVSAFLASIVVGATVAPLRVLTVTPAPRNVVKAKSVDVEEVTISNRQAITVSFNFAYIALGSDFGPGPLPEALVPVTLEPRVLGRMQWVTTSILRFDPSEDWPAELQLRLTLLDSAQSYDGRQLESSGQRVWRFRTLPLRMWISDVLSDRAKVLTDGRWSAGMGRNSHGVEVPPDGRIQLRFSSEVDASMIRPHLRLLHDAKQRISRELDFGPCPGRERKCVEVGLSPPLDVDGQYQLVLDKGASFNRDAGLTHKELKVKVAGLHNFSFPFLDFDTTGKEAWLMPKFRRQRLWLRHGLQDGINLKQLAAQFKLSPHLPVNLSRPEAAVLQLEAAFEPDTEYTLQVRANSELKDGFGLPLLSSECRFMTAKLEHLFLTPGSSSYNAEPAMFPMANASKMSWPVLVRGVSQCLDWPDAGNCQQTQHMSITPVLKENAKEAIASVYSSSHVFVQTDGLPVAGMSAPPPPHSDYPVVFDVPLSEVLDPSGLAMRTAWMRRDSQGTLYKQSSFLGVPSMVATLAATSTRVLMVWVLRASDNTPVANASVRVYGSARRWEATPKDINQLISQKTNEHGLAHLQSPMFDGLQLSVVVDAPGEALLIEPDVPAFQSLPEKNDPIGRVITDRAVYKPLDDIHIKGYIRDRWNVVLTLPDSSSKFYLCAYWARRDPVTIPIVVDAAFGSFSATLKVPAEAHFGATTIRLVQDGSTSRSSPENTPCLGSRGIGSSIITVADPRPPTVALKVDAHEGFLQPGGHLMLSLSTKTLIGIPVSGADVKLVWNLHRAPSDVHARAFVRAVAPHGESQVDSGEEHFQTSSNGSITLSWRPENLSHQEKIGDHVSLHFSWVGPTRELLQHSIEIPVARSKWTIDLEVPSGEETLPGIPFRVHAKARSQITLPDKIDETPGLSIILYETKSRVTALRDIDPNLLPAHSSLIQRCNKLPCDLEMKSMGNYSVVACTTGVHVDVPICSTTPVGRAIEEWQKTPLRNFLDPAITFSTDRSRYYAGDRPKLMFYNPLPELRAFLTWGNQNLYKHMVTNEIDFGHVSIELPALAEECDHGCSVWVFLCAPSNSSRELPVPTSPLFDLHGPMSAQKKIDLEVEARERQEILVTIKPEVAILEPGSEAVLEIALSNVDGSAVSGEVCIFGVDEAFLNLKPHPPLNLTGEFSLNLLSQLRYIFTHRDLLSLQGLNMSLEYLQRLLLIDPWLVQQSDKWPLHPMISSWFEVPLPDLLDKFTSDLTSMPHGSRRGAYAYAMPIMERGAPVPMMAMMAEDEEMVAGDAAPNAPMFRSKSLIETESRRKSSTGDQAQASSTSIDPSRVRSNFKVVPLFLPAVSVKGGVAHVKWKLPDNTGSFELRAYAVSTDGRFGGGSVAHQVARRLVSLSPSVPRIARIFDTFKAGATLTNADKNAIVVNVSIAVLGGNMELRDVRSRVSTQQIELKAEETKEVVFLLHAIAIGNTSAVLTVGHFGKVIDSLRVDVEILGLQPEAHIATSFPIKASPAPSLPWQEGLALPVAASGSGKISFTAGVGRLPAVQNLAAKLLKVQPGGEHTAYEMLGVAARAAFFKPYEKISDSLYAEAESRLDYVIAELDKLTTVSGGLHYMAFLIRDDTQANVDLQLNAFALYVVRRLKLAGVPLSEYWTRMESSWRDAVSRGLVTYAERVLKDASSKFTDYETLVVCRIALGTSWQPTSLGHRKSAYLIQRLQKALSMEALFNAVDSLSVFSKAALCMLLVLPRDPFEDAPGLLGTTQAPFASQLQIIIVYLNSLVRVTARTAYVAGRPGSAHATSMRVNGMVLSAFALAGKQLGAGFADKIANYVARDGENSGSASTTIVAFGLVDYDASSQSSAANVDFKVLSGMSPLVSWQLESTDVAAKTKELPWNVFPVPAPPLLFEAEGIGEVSVAVSLSFVPAKTSEHAIFRGIGVEKVLQKNSELYGAYGKPIFQVQLGHVISVTLQITCADDLRGVLVEDWLPAGLEALDPNLGDSRSPNGFQMQCPMWSWWRCTTFKQETKKDRVSFYSPVVFAGTHVLQYQAIAATRGEFMLPPTRAWVVLEPEVMGFSGSGKFNVLDAQEHLTQTAGSSLLPPKSCPQDCSGRGICDTALGTCTCNVGCAGPDCSLTAKLPKMLPLLDGADGNDSLVLTNHDEGFALNVTLMTDDAGKVFPEYLFVRALQRDDILSTRVVQSESGQKQVIVALSQNIAEAFTTDVVVSASGDGSLFASRRLSVSLFPKCIPGSSRWCRCPIGRSKPARAAGMQDCFSNGTFDQCDCMREDRVQHNVLTTKTPSHGGPSILSGLCLVPLAICICCYFRHPSRQHKRNAESQLEEDILLYPSNSNLEANDNLLAQDVGQSHRTRQVSRSRGQMASGDYIDASDLAE